MPKGTHSEEEIPTLDGEKYLPLPINPAQQKKDAAKRKAAARERRRIVSLRLASLSLALLITGYWGGLTTSWWGPIPFFIGVILLIIALAINWKEI